MKFVYLVFDFNFCCQSSKTAYKITQAIQLLMEALF